jgi:hypothetical protein
VEKNTLEGFVLLTQATLGETDAEKFSNDEDQVTVRVTFPLKSLMLVTFIPNEVSVVRCGLVMDPTGPLGLLSKYP